jgi:pre-mRNA-processing factor 17
VFIAFFDCLHRCFGNTDPYTTTSMCCLSLQVWDVMSDRNVRRTYSGHTAAVREVKFNNDGLKFSSVSYDRHVKFWDTESGKCTMDITNGKVPYCCTWYPDDNNIVLIGTANRKIMQYDIRSGEMVLEYDSHLGAVNTITFFDENRRLATTSDDKKVIIWDFNAPVPIKTIADPSMHAITAATLHPDGATIACQSMDNQVAVYYSGEKTGLNRRKRFTGHVVAGYACQVGFSPNGQYVISGDGEGNVWFWDWKTTKVLKKLKCHDHGPAISVGWHPVNPSWVATCGWDGLIKLWD